MEKIFTEIEKNKPEINRVELSEFNGHDLFDLRVYFNREDDEPAPTKKGITRNVSFVWMREEKFY